MRYLIVTATALALVACEKRTDREAMSTADSARTADTVMARDTASTSASASPAATAVADSLSAAGRPRDTTTARAEPSHSP